MLEDHPDNFDDLEEGEVPFWCHSRLEWEYDEEDDTLVIWPAGYRAYAMAMKMSRATQVLGLIQQIIEGSIQYRRGLRRAKEHGPAAEAEFKRREEGKSVVRYLEAAIQDKAREKDEEGEGYV